MRLIEPSEGTIALDGRDITHLSHAGLRPLRRRMQMIFQDPYSSLNPRMRAGAIVGEPLLVHGIGSEPERRERVAELFRRVGLRPDQQRNFPSQFSGGQRQGLPSPARSRSTQVDRRRRAGFGPRCLDPRAGDQSDGQDPEGAPPFILFISHDLGLVQQVSDRVMVMYLGRVVETGTTAALFASPRHPYTCSCLPPCRDPIRSDAAPRARPSRARCRADSRRRPAAPFIRAARSRPNAAGASARSCGRLSAERRSPVTTWRDLGNGERHGQRAGHWYHAEAPGFALTIRLGCELFREVPEAGAARSASADRAAHKELDRNGGRCRD